MNLSLMTLWLFSVPYALGEASEKPGESPIEAEVKLVVVVDDARVPTFGSLKENCFPSREAALERRERFREESRPISVREFLGAGIERVFVGFMGPGVTEESATTDVEAWLDSVLIDPRSRCGGGPELGRGWAESNILTVRGAILYAPRFESGPGIRVHEGACSSRGSFDLGGPNYFVVRDAHGVYWWHRWDQCFPKRSIHETSRSDE